MSVRASLLLILLAPACSLSGVTDIRVPACASHADCDALNLYYDLDAASCELYQCRASECRLAPRDLDEDDHLPVACGGDDCDDGDPGWFNGPSFELTTVLPGITASPRWVHWGSQLLATDATCGESMRLGVSYDRGDVASFDLLPTPRADCVPDLTPTSIRFAMDAILTDVEAIEIVAGCPIFHAGTATPPPPEPTSPVAGMCDANADCDDATFCNGFEYCDSAAASADDEGCNAASPASPCPDEQCDEPLGHCLTVDPTPLGNCPVNELATSHLTGDAWLGAAVRRGQCPYGQLRIGWLSTAAEAFAAGLPGPNVLVRGDQKRAPSFWGIDLVGSGLLSECSGAARFAAGGPLGVSSPAIATLPVDVSAPRRRPQGLIAWLGAPMCRQIGCVGTFPEFTYSDTDAVSVELIGAWFEQSAAEGGSFWTTPTGDGGPVRLTTRTLGRAAPALVAVQAPAPGYLLAYGAEPGGLVLRFLPAFADPPEIVESVEPFVTPLTDALGRRVTAPISEGTEHAILRTASSLIDDVSIAVGTPLGDVLPIALAWLEDGELWTATGELDTGTDELTMNAALRIAASTPPVGPPRIAAGCGPGCSGWSVAYTIDEAVSLAILDASGAMLGAAITIGGEGATHPIPVPTSTSVRVFFHDRTLDGFVVSSGICPPS